MPRPAFLLTAVLVSGCLADAPEAGPTASASESPAVIEAALVAPVASLPPDRLVVALGLPRGSSFGEVVERWGVPAHAVRDAAMPIHDLALVNPEHELALELLDGAEGPVAVRYEIDDDHSVVVRRAAEGWTAEVEEVAYELREIRLALEINSSLWAAADAAGLGWADIAHIAQVFEFEVDFNTEIRKGAQLGLVGDVRSAEGRRDRLGTLHALRLINGDALHELVRFVDEEGKEQFFHPDGTSAKRAFLRSPLEFSRVTSGFNPRRFHPVLKVARPHNGTDFGAPTGTSVRSVADGVVTFAGRNGGHGNYVKIRHDDVYETSYSHLSAITVRKGQRLTQGQVLGRVGSTGMSTGPHLHFQMWKRGRFVDALREDVPRATKVAAHQLEEFRAEVARWLPQLPVASPVAARTPDR